MKAALQAVRTALSGPSLWVGAALAIGVGLAFWLVAQREYYQYLNYTFLIASALLHGQLGTTTAPSWLNELVPAGGGLYYSVFPLGAVLSVLPLSLLADPAVEQPYPVNLLVAIIAAGCTALAYAYTAVRPDFSLAKRAGLALWLVAGTWFMTNLLFAGAWQLALGLAVLGQLAALYWSVVRPRPWLAGLALAVAFGNRTEVLLTAPIFAIFLLRPYWPAQPGQLVAGTWRQKSAVALKAGWPTLAKFVVIPIALGLATLAYNAARFGSPADFGYARIPGVLEEPWYQYGIFSVTAIADNVYQMLIAGWRWIPKWPYFVPSGWGGSILLASPALLLLIRRPRGDRLRVSLAWAAMALIVAVLWAHGSAGAWQYSYRYGLTLLPWFLVLLAEYLPARIKWYEVVLWVASLAISAWATYLFMWTELVRFFSSY